MNDLERDLRTLLDEKAARAGAPMPDERLLKRARRRQVGTVLGGALVALAVVAGAVLTVSAFGPSDPRTPAEPSDRLVTTTVNGVTIQHPEGWNAVDPVEVGIETSEDALPKLVLLLSPLDPATLEELAWCPRSSDGLLMTVEESPVVPDGADTQAWPADLVPMDTEGLGAAEIGASGCFPEWTFLVANWTDSGRTFEAFVGYGPAVSDEDRDSLEATFASMRFAPSGSDEKAWVIATGTAGGEDWDLIAEVNEGFFQLRLHSKSWGAAQAFPDEPGTPDELEFWVAYPGSGTEREVVVVGAAVSPVVGVEATPLGGGTAVSAEVVDVPDEIGGTRDAFVLVYRPGPFPDPGATLAGYDGAGNVVATANVPPEGPVRVVQGTEVASGADWGLWIDDDAGLCWEVATAWGAGNVGPIGEFGCQGGWDEEVGTADVLALPNGRALIYGFVRPETDRLVIRLEDGTTFEPGTITAPGGFAYDIEVFAIELEGASGAGRISALDADGIELGHTNIRWTPNRGDNVRFEPSGG